MDTISNSTTMMPSEKVVTSRSTKSGGKVASRRHKQKADRVGVSPILSPVDAIYHEFVKTFGNSNQSQVFSLIWPGTILNPASYDGVGDNGLDGVLASIAQSLLFDQHYPVGTITQTDGTRVSDRYGQAIQRYGVVPNASLLSLQSTLRDRLSQVTQTSINGQLVSMTLLDQFNYLNGIWTDRRQQWDDKQTAMIQQFKAGGDANWFADYVEWYGINAQPYLDSINAAYDRMIAEFPLNAFQDALSILGTQDAATLLRARNDLANATIPVPASIGNDYVVTQAIPEDWGSILTSSMTFVDLLASPQAQQAALDTAITVLQQQIYAWQAILAQIPAGSAADIAAALAAFEEAGKTYSAAVDSTLNTYTNNAVTAVQIFMNNQQDETTLGQINQAKQDMDIAAGDQPADLNQEQVGAIIKDIGQGQSDLITSNSSMVSAGYNLASKATAYLNSKNGAGLKSMIQPVVDQLTSQLALITQKAADFASSAARAQQMAAGASPAFKDGPVLDPVMPSNTSSAINQRWSEITLSVNTSAMDTSSTASTSYEQMNWSVDLFFGSAGGESSEASSSFASDYMKQDSAIEIGMLATKVVIQRPWMHPELFNLSSNYFRVGQDPVTTPTPPEGGWTRDLIVPQDLGGGAPGTSGGMAARALNQGPFPAYPVALLLVKDVTIKFSYDSAKTSAFEQHSSSNSTQGGGFFCFSVSEQQSSSSDVKGSSSYSQAGTYAFKIAAPQVIGTWLQITPPDNSVPLDETLASEIADSLGFVTKLQVVAKVGRAVLNPPSQPRAS